MRIGIFLPHVGVFGGVRRFVELGNAWTAVGHGVTLFHPTGDRPGWIGFDGATAPLEAAASESSDLAICADPHTLDAFLAHRAERRLYYCIIEKDPGVLRAAARGVPVAANSGRLLRRLQRRLRTPVIDGVGGINPRQFHPDPSRRRHGVLRVLLNGRRSRSKKGTDLILRALDDLSWRVAPPEIVLFDHVALGERDPRAGAPLPSGARYVLNPSQEELVALYQSAHVFIAAERKAGWCNTALEAMACGCAVACTRSGTTDFARDGATALVVRWRHSFFVGRAARRLLNDATLRERLSSAGAAEALRWSWEMLARKLLQQVESG